MYRYLISCLFVLAVLLASGTFFIRDYWEHRFDANAPLYMQVSRAGLALHLSEHHGDATPWACIDVSVRGLDVFHREITDKKYPFLRPGIESTFYGSRCLEVIDPFGNRIRFDEVIA